MGTNISATAAATGNVPHEIEVNHFRQAASRRDIQSIQRRENATLFKQYRRILVDESG